MSEFQKGRRYRLTILPAGARTRTITFDANYLWPRTHEPGVHDFDCRPESGTQQIREDAIRECIDIGPSVDGRAIEKGGRKPPRPEPGENSLAGWARIIESSAKQ